MAAAAERLLALAFFLPLPPPFVPRQRSRSNSAAAAETLGLIKTKSQEFNFSEWAELTPLEETPELDCFPTEALLIVEKPLWQDCRLVMEPR